MNGRSMKEFIPICTRASDAQDNLASWIESWLVPEGESLEVLKPEGWYQKGHDIIGFTKNCDDFDIPVYKKGFYLWTPPPAVADAVVEELRKARHKRQESTHVFACPKVMKPWWMGQLYKVADVVLEVKAGKVYWDKNNHEPLILAICFPFVSHNPWQLRNTPRVCELARILRRVWRNGEGSERDILRKFCASTRSMASMSESLVWTLLQSRSNIDVSNCKA